jgi:hypothetical protein
MGGVSEGKNQPGSIETSDERENVENSGAVNADTFKYERLPKFCFRCGVIKHGATRCSARSTNRKQNASTEFEMWLRANSLKWTFIGKLG